MFVLSHGVIIIRPSRRASVSPTDRVSKQRSASVSCLRLPSTYQERDIGASASTMRRSPLVALHCLLQTKGRTRTSLSSSHYIEYGLHAVSVGVFTKNKHARERPSALSNVDSAFFCQDE